MQADQHARTGAQEIASATAKRAAGILSRAQENRLAEMERRMELLEKYHKERDKDR
jgi:hypothetical protein